VIAKAVAQQSKKATKDTMKNVDRESQSKKVPDTEVLTVPAPPANPDTIAKIAEILQMSILSACLTAEYASRKRFFSMFLSDLYRKIFGQNAMSKFLHDNALKLCDVPSDGNCAYYMYCLFVGWDLSQVTEMRIKLANFMELHRDLFKSLQPQGKLLDFYFDITR
jgi:hypothetical protein